MDNVNGMTKYEPGARRPIADIFRATARRSTTWCVRHHVHPDTISYASMIAAAAAAICFWKAGQYSILLLIAPLLCYLRLWFNMLDGMVALAANKASARGEILNDLPDRASDVMIFAGVAQSGLVSPILGYWAALFAVLTAYVGLLGQAVGGRREFGGIMSKPWRMVALHVGAWTTAILWKISGTARMGPLTVLDWTCLAIVLGCLQTIHVRLRRIMLALENK
jgi:phosphatidylglycerophosphate synthase